MLSDTGLTRRAEAGWPSHPLLHVYPLPFAVPKTDRRYQFPSKTPCCYHSPRMILHVHVDRITPSHCPKSLEIRSHLIQHWSTVLDLRTRDLLQLEEGGEERCHLPTERGSIGNLRSERQGLMPHVCSDQTTL